jgi:hypothetical protein
MVLVMNWVPVAEIDWKVPANKTKRIIRGNEQFKSHASFKEYRSTFSSTSDFRISPYTTFKTL